MLLSWLGFCFFCLFSFFPGSQRLIKSGVDEENIVVVSITSGPGALDNLAKNYPDVQVVTASIEAGLDRKFQLMPGVGVFSTRYSPEE